MKKLKSLILAALLAACLASLWIPVNALDAIEGMTQEEMEAYVEKKPESLKEGLRQFICSHNETLEKVVFPPSCIAEGIRTEECKKCGKVLKSEPIPKTQHTLVDTTIKEPTCTEEGLCALKCVHCGYEENYRSIPKTSHLLSVIERQESTCTQTGSILRQCTVCGYRQEDLLPQKKHQLSYLKTIPASPESAGHDIAVCSTCGTEEIIGDVYFENKIKTWHKYGLCIPSADINATLPIGPHAQEFINSNDIGMIENRLGVNDKLILGHSTYSFGRLPRVQVGDFIYLYEKDNSYAKYRVTVSEPGIENASFDNIVGMNTGAEVLYHANVDTLHFYTCYHSGGATRWIVLAERMNKNIKNCPIIHSLKYMNHRKINKRRQNRGYPILAAFLLCFFKSDSHLITDFGKFSLNGLLAFIPELSEACEASGRFPGRLPGAESESLPRLPRPPE